MMISNKVEYLFILIKGLIMILYLKPLLSGLDFLFDYIAI